MEKLTKRKSRATPRYEGAPHEARLRSASPRTVHRRSGAHAPALAPAGHSAPSTRREVAVLPPAEARVLFRLSFLILGPLVLAAVLRIPDGVVVCALVFLFSVNHWRRPVYGPRRTADVANAFACLFYQSWNALSRNVAWRGSYFAVTYAGVAVFAVRVWLVSTRRIGPRTSMALHCAVHLLANAGNVCLYLGVQRARSLALAGAAER